MSGDGDDRNLAQPGLASQRIGQLADHVARHHDLTEQLGIDAHLLEQLFFELLRAGIEHLGGRSDRILDHFLTRQHVTQRVGDEQSLLGGGQQRRLIALHRVKLVQAVEVHHLNAGSLVHLLARHDLLEILFGSPHRMRIAVRIGHAQHLAVGPQKGEIDAPCVDTDRFDLDILFRGGDHTGLQMLVQRIDIPVKMSAQLENLVREASQLLHLELALVQRPEDRAAAGGSQIEREKRILLHLSYRFGFKLFVFCLSPRKTAGCCYPPGKRSGEAAIYASSPAPLLVRRRPGDVRIFPFVLR